ncbi:MAG: serine hydrolase domain-containing protein [Pseudomonadota bacterium]
MNTSFADCVEHLNRACHEEQVPGAAIAIVSGAEPPAVVGVGTVHTGQSAPVDGDTVFQAASLSKPVFARLVIQLAQAGRFELMRPLADFDVAPPLPDAALRNVTARHVLRHATGLPNWFWTDEVRRMVCPPDTAFTYSGLAYMYLQQVIEGIVAAPLDEWSHQTLIEPLGLDRTSYRWHDRFSANHASAHDVSGNAIDAYRFNEARSASSLYTTARDYARFLAEVLNDATAIGIVDSETTVIEDNIEWGLGWGIERRGSSTLLFHWGDNPGFNCFALLDPAERFATVILTNGQSGRRVYSNVLEAWYGDSLGCLRWLASRY